MTDFLQACTYEPAVNKFKMILELVNHAIALSYDIIKAMRIERDSLRVIALRKLGNDNSPFCKSIFCVMRAINVLFE